MAIYKPTLTIDEYIDSYVILGDEEKEKLRETIPEQLIQLRQVISKDFDSNFLNYMEYLILRRHLEQQGSVFYPYVRILEKTKDVEKCLNSIPFNHIEKIRTPDDMELALALRDVGQDSKYGDAINYLKASGDSGRMATEGLYEKIEARADELSKEYEQFDKKTKKEFVKALQRGKLTDATVELEKILESSKPIPERSLKDCLDAYVNLGGALGFGSIQAELEELAKISKGMDGEIHVNLDAETYRQLKDIIKKIQEEFENSTLDKDINVYRGVGRDSFLSLLKSNGINIKKEDFTIENVSSKIKNKLLNKKGFTSTTKSKKIAEEFATRDFDDLLNETDEKSCLGAIFKIKLKKGTNMIDVNKTLRTKKFEREKEILLPDNTALMIHFTKPYIHQKGDNIRYLLFIAASVERK